jgi:hypothetical protein
MEDIKKITEQMLHKELVDTLNYNFQKLDKDFKEHRSHTKIALDNLSGSIKDLRVEIKELRTGIEEILSILKSR